MKQYMTVENLKVVGNGAKRIGVEIIKEGTKTVAIKGAASVVGGLIANGVEGVKQLDLNDVLGDITRAERKEEKRLKRMAKKEAKRAEKQRKIDEAIDKVAEQTIEDLENLDK